jgi:hypothetical protein
MADLHSVQERLRAFAQAEDAVRRNKDLSPTGQQRQLDSIRQTRAAYRATAVRDLADDWQSVRKLYARLSERRAELEDKAGGDWDFNRLAYLEREVRSAIMTAADNPLTGKEALADIRRAYEAARGSGDRHLARVWAGIGPGTLRQRFGESQAGSLIGEMDRDLAALLRTPEMDEVERKAAALIERAFALQAVTAEARAAFNPNFASPFAGRDEFAALTEGITLEERYDSDRAQFNRTLVIETTPAPAGDAQRPGAPASPVPAIGG